MKIRQNDLKEAKDILREETAFWMRVYKRLIPVYLKLIGGSLVFCAGISLIIVLWRIVQYLLDILLPASPETYGLSIWDALLLTLAIVVIRLLAAERKRHILEIKEES